MANMGSCDDIIWSALFFRTHLGSLTRCSKYTLVHMFLGTHVRQTTLCVTFGARLRSALPRLLDRLLGARTANAAQALRNGSK